MAQTFFAKIYLDRCYGINEKKNSNFYPNLGMGSKGIFSLRPWSWSELHSGPKKTNFRQKVGGKFQTERFGQDFGKWLLIFSPMRALSQPWFEQRLLCRERWWRPRLRWELAKERMTELVPNGVRSGMSWRTWPYWGWNPRLRYEFVSNKCVKYEIVSSRCYINSYSYIRPQDLPRRHHRDCEK